MGHCCSKNLSAVDNETSHPDPHHKPPHSSASPHSPVHSVSGVTVATPALHSYTNSYSASPFNSPLPPSPGGTPGRKFRWPLPPPSPVKPIMAAILKRQGKAQPKEGSIPEGQGETTPGERPLDKSFGFAKNIGAKYELGKEVGRGHFGHTHLAKAKKGVLKGQSVAVKIISKAKMTTAIAIEDVRREVKILKALSGHKNVVKFHDAFEDANSVYIVMELCEGGELLDRILSRGGRYTEQDAKAILVQALNVMAYCHLQGVVHRDLKPENFLFASKDDDALMKVIDFGLSDFVRPDQRLSEVVGSAYYVAPEVLHRSYSVEADLWSIGVITYILLCGSRPFWARSESGIFRSVLKANPNFDDSPWPSVSLEAKDFVKRLLNKDLRKRMSAAQALTHPWLRNENQAIPLDILIYKQVKSYLHATPLRRAALKALSKALTEDELIYLRAQFSLLEPKNGCVSLDNFRAALMKNATDMMKEAKVPDILNSMDSPASVKMDFEEFCAAAISVYQLEVHEEWDKISKTAFQYFEQAGNRVISVEELAEEMNLGASSYSLLGNWIRESDGKFSFVGYAKFMHGITIRSSNTRQRQNACLTNFV